jgi:methylmalonyl-CoA/ethylmalonyl-CoA epimerase
VKLDHIALAVHDLAAAVDLFVDVLGGEFVMGGDHPIHGFRAVQVRFPPAFKVELLQPVAQDCYLHAFLASRGQGFHHLTGYVDDVAATAAHLEAAGYPTTGTTTDSATWHETFVRPAASFGALHQFAHTTSPWPQPAEGVTAADVLAGRIGVNDNVMWWKSNGAPIAPRQASDGA